MNRKADRPAIGTRAGLSLIVHALGFAATSHAGQRRKDADATPYINHPIALVDVLVNEAGIDDPIILAAAILHDTIEDTAATVELIERRFGPRVAAIVAEVTDDRSKLKAERKRLQIVNAAGASYEARLVKLADKICNLRDMHASPPNGWDLDRRREYFDWARAVVDQMRGTHPRLETLFDQAFAQRP
jgi:guanosine-3',5'-bis(diphosphate) 3'-pyrophosphohydrolase